MNYIFSRIKKLIMNSNKENNHTNDNVKYKVNNKSVNTHINEKFEENVRKSNRFSMYDILKSFNNFIPINTQHKPYNSENDRMRVRGYNSIAYTDVNEAFKINWIDIKDEIKNTQLVVDYDEKIKEIINIRDNDSRNIKYETKNDGIKRRRLESEEQCSAINKKYISYK